MAFGLRSSYSTNTGNRLVNKCIVNAYLALAAPAIEKSKGKILASTNIVDAHENGVAEQTVLVEFDSLEKAKTFYYGNEYQSALKALDGGADRDIRIFEGKE